MNGTLLQCTVQQFPVCSQLCIQNIPSPQSGHQTLTRLSEWEWEVGVLCSVKPVPRVEGLGALGQLLSVPFPARRPRENLAGGAGLAAAPGASVTRTVWLSRL